MAPKSKSTSSKQTPPPDVVAAIPAVDVVFTDAETPLPPRPDFAVEFPHLDAAYAAVIYDLAVQGVGDREIAKRMRVPFGRFKIELGPVTMRARQHFPTRTVQRAMALYRGQPLPAELGGGLALPPDTIERIRQLALEGMPDRFIVIGASITPDVLHEPAIKQMVEEARLTMTRRLVQHLIHAAMGNENIIDAIAEQLTDAKLNNEPLDNSILQQILDTLSSERVGPNLAIAEKILQRLGYFEAPMQAEIKVRVTFDAPPVRTDGPTGTEVKGEAVVRVDSVDDIDT
jgi:hypothetical protein